MCGSCPDVWQNPLNYSSHQSDHVELRQIWNKKKPAAEIIRMGAMLANKDAV